MARPAGGINTFEAYFQKADLDRDGKISGAEAVTFFQGSNLSKNVLAQIWMHADQKRTGFLGRAEFYNALKLVTVAQSGRELTPDLVRAALSGPASSQIPAPVIAGFPSSAPSVPPSSSTGLASPSVAASGVVASIPTVSVVQPRPGTASTYASLPNNQFLHNQSFSRPPTSNSMQNTVLSPVLPGVGLTSQHPQISGGLSGWPALRVQGSSSAATNHVPVSQALQATTSTSMPSKQDNLGQTPSGFLSGSGSLTTPRSISDTVKTNISEGNGLSANSLFGDIAASALSPSTALVSASTMSAPSQPKQIEIDKSQNLPLVPVSSSVGLTSLRTGGPAQFSWPKMAQSKVQSYAKIFSEVDTDRDGKITGEQARNLFLSWKLPREVLKQVWDLSDQDDDSMLSLREFCIALYLMEQYREGRPLPRVLPSEICVDEALKLIPGLQKSSQQSIGPNGLQWQQNTGMPSQGGHYGAHPSNLTRFPVTPHGDFRGVQAIPNHVGGSRMPQSDTVGAQMPRKEAPLPKSTLTNSRMPILEMDLVTQLPRDEQDKLNSKHTVAEEAEKKVHELEKDIMDSKEKIAFYRSKLQELILYKTRCDNRINEITERAAADKREVEAMAKKYEEKYKLAGESNSRLASEEALFKDLQERKLELHNVIVRMEQGGNGDSLLQVRADRIQADLEELWKTLKERSKQLGLQTKPTSVMELPFGWQAPLHDNVAEWDDNWDKFQDEGFTTVQEVVSENPMPKHPGKANSESAWDDNSTVEDEFDSPSLNNVHVKDDNLPLSANMNENGSTDAQTEEGSSKSAPGSPARDSFKTVNNYDDVSLRGQETQRISADVYAANHPQPSAEQEFLNSNHVNSSNPIDLFGDPGAWEAAFTKGNDVNDSLWGFDKATGESKSSSDMGASATALDKSLERHSDNPTFDALDSFNLKQSSVSSPKGIAEDDAGVGIGTFAPVRTKDKSLFSVADNSVPSTPLFNSTSPGGQSNSGFFEDNNSRFDSFTRFDSFNARDRSVFGAQDTFANFDSFKGKDEGQNKTFGRFDSFNAKDDGHNTAFASFDSFTANYDGHSREFTSFDSFKVKDDGHSTQLAGFDSFKAKDDAQGSIFGTSDAFRAKDEGSNTVFASFDSFKAKDDGHGTTLASFDSFKPKDGGHSRGFASFDDSDPFGSSGPFSLGDQTPKHKSTGGWSAF